MNFSSGGSEFKIFEPAHLATLTFSVVIDFFDHYKLVARLVLTTNIRVTHGHYNLVPGRPLHYLLFQVSSGHNFVTVQNQTHVPMNFFA